jgi:hypothetical protein
MLQSWKKIKENGYGDQNSDYVTLSLIGDKADSIFEIQRRAIKELIKNASGTCVIYGYAGNAWEAEKADDLICCEPQEPTPGWKSWMRPGTSFISVFSSAYSHKGDVHIHLFSDGYPQRESEAEIMAARNGTKGDITTYYIGDPCDGDAFGLMRRLARGNGTSHAVNSEPDLVKAVRASARPSRNRLQDIKDSLAHARTRAELGGQIANLSGVVDRVAHDRHELAQDHNTTRTELNTLAQADAATLEALQVLRQQRDANIQSRVGDTARHAAMLEHAGANFGQLASEFLGSQLLTVAERTASSTGIAARPAFQPRTLDAGLMTRAAALLSAPSGSGVGALPAAQSQPISGAAPAAAPLLTPPSDPSSEGQGPSKRRWPYGH